MIARIATLARTRCPTRIGRGIYWNYPHARAHGNRNKSRSTSSTVATLFGLTAGFGNTLTNEYNALVNEKKLIFDPEQERVVKKFTRLQGAIDEYDHKLLFQQLQDLEEHKGAELQKQHNDASMQQTPDTAAPPSITVPIPRGIYLYGDVGTGKSLLMNMLYNSSTVKKRRLHFHSLLQEIHSRIFQLNKDILAKHGRSFHVDTSKDRNPIIKIAQQLSSEVTLLCIDEFQVTDVADAMILSQLFGELWRQGVVVVATSNRPPQDLYEDGLNKSYFLPFIDLLERYCLVLRLGTHHDASNEARKPTDYRRIKSAVDGSIADRTHGDYYFLTHEGNGSTKMLDQLFDNIQQNNNIRGSIDVIQERSRSESNSTPSNAQEHLTLQVKFQRNITISRYHSNVIARFTFEELCTTELGSSDYQAIANNFRVVMIENIPQLTLKYPDRARRFITLVDELYESGCCLICSADEIPDNLFVGQIDSKTNRAVDANDENNDTKDLLAVDVAQSQGMAVSELASVKELSFAFRRAASRLLEMCSDAWWEENGMFQRMDIDKMCRP